MASTPGSAKVTSEKTAIFRVFAALLLPFMHFVGKYHYHGSLPRTGAVVVSPNHYSNIDPIVIGVAMWYQNRMPRYLAKASLFRVPVLGWMLRKAGQVPVERAGRPRSGADPLAQARKIAADGLAVVIYPEGSLTRDPDYWPMRGKFGAVRTALDAHIPLIPVASWGAEKILPRYGKFSFFPRKDVHIVFGEPLDLSEFEGKPLDNATLAAATDKLMNAITALLEGLRGEKAPAERWDPAAHGQSEIGKFTPPEA